MIVRSNSLWRKVQSHRSSNALAWGDRGGIRIAVMPDVERTACEANGKAPEFGVDWRASLDAWLAVGSSAVRRVVGAIEALFRAGRSETHCVSGSIHR